jgi:predicted GIY-YIG superfamily endonuclease
MFYVYSLKCKDGYYIGCCEDLKERFERHKNGHVPATANGLPIVLEFYSFYTPSACCGEQKE